MAKFKSTLLTGALILLSPTLFALSPEEIAKRTEHQTEAYYQAQFANEARVMNEVIANLQAKKESLSKINGLEEQKNAVLKHIDQVLKQKNETIFAYMKLNKEIQEKARKNEIQLTERLKYEWQKRQLTDSVDLENQKVVELEGQLAKSEFEASQMKTLLKEQERSYHFTVSRLTEHVKQLSSSLARVSPTLPEPVVVKGDNLHLQLNVRMEDLRELQNKLSAEMREVTHLKDKLQIKDQSYDQLVLVNRDLSMALTKAEQKIDYLIRENGELITTLAQKNSEIEELDRLAQGQEDFFRQQELYLESKLVEATQNKPFKSQNFGRFPASVDTDKIVAKLNKILNDPAQKFESKAPGQVSISLNEEFYFENEQGHLTDFNKAKLHSLFKLYTEVIFEEEDLRDKLISVEFVGHASPWYQSKLTDPKHASDEAYQHNLKLSLERARQLAEFIFGDHFGEFPHKHYLRQRTSVIGKSFSEPMPARVPAQASSPCGQYDCQGSRRVEVFFYFKKD